MPEKVHDCVDDIEGIEGEDSKWAVCTNAIQEGSIINLLGIGGSIDKMKEHHNPLDIPFGHELKEVNNNVRDVHQEGGLGSGRHKQAGSGASGGGQGGGDGSSSGQGFGGGGPAPGELITFETTTPNILKQLLDTKLKECSCHKN